MPNELPDCRALFVRFLSDSGDDAAARTRFQRLVTDLVFVRIPGASEVAFPGGGDWGIDTYVGSLDADIVVWQSKFFMSWGKTQQAEIRGSFKQVVEKASQEGFTATAWTLCVPSVLPPDQQKWFDNWSKKQSRETGIRIDLWNGVQIRAALQQPDARHLRELYFSDHAPAGGDLPVAALTDPAVLADALFVVQLEAAGRVETDAAKGFYFAAEAMARDVAGRGVTTEISALTEAELEAHGVWERTFNAKSSSASEDGRMVGLVDDVNTDVGNLAATADLRLRPAHRRGLVHRLVEGARAGWVTHWRDVAATHQSTPAGTVVEQTGDLAGESVPMAPGGEATSGG